MKPDIAALGRPASARSMCFKSMRGLVALLATALSWSVGPSWAEATGSLGAPEAVSIARAQAALASSQAQVAESDYRKALELAPGSVEARLGLVRALLEQRRVSAAEAVLAPLAATSASEPGVLLAQAWVDIERERPERALATLDRVDRDHPGRPEVSYLRGLIRYRRGRYDEAATELGRVTEGPPAVVQAARLVRGAALARTGRAGEARAEFLAVQSSPARPRLAELAGRLQSDDVSARPAGSAGRTHGSVRVSMQHDDNAVVAPTTNVFGLGAQRKASTGTLLNGVVTHDLERGADRGSTLAYSFLQTLNWQIHQVDLQDHALSVFTWRDEARRRHPVRWGVQASLDELLVDEAAFLGRIAFAPYVTVGFSPRSATTAQLRLTRKNFLRESSAVESTAEDRDARNAQLALVHQVSVGRNGYRASAGLAGDVESAVGANVSYRGLRYTAGLTGQFPDSRLGFNLQLALHDRHYDNVHTAFALKRHDDDWTYFGGLSYRLSPDRSLALEYTRNRNLSNLALFDFARNTTSLAYVATF